MDNRLTRWILSTSLLALSTWCGAASYPVVADENGNVWSLDSEQQHHTKTYIYANGSMYYAKADELLYTHFTIPVHDCVTGRGKLDVIVTDFPREARAMHKWTINDPTAAAKIAGHICSYYFFTKDKP